MVDPALPPLPARFTLRRRLVGGGLRVLDPRGISIGRARRRFGLSEGLKLHLGDRVIAVRVRSLGKLSPVFDVAVEGERIGAIQRRGLRSIVRGEWWILAPGGARVGRAVEGWGLALLRRLLEPLIGLPRRWRIEAGGGLGSARARLSPAGPSMEVCMPEGIDPRLGLALATLLLDLGEERD